MGGPSGVFPSCFRSTVCSCIEEWDGHLRCYVVSVDKNGVDRPKESPGRSLLSPSSGTRVLTSRGYATVLLAATRTKGDGFLFAHSRQVINSRSNGTTLTPATIFTPNHRFVPSYTHRAYNNDPRFHPLWIRSRRRNEAGISLSRP